MQFRAAERMVSLNADELTAAVQGPTGPLAPRTLVAAASGQGDRAAFDQQPQEVRALLDETLGSLLDPVRRLDVHLAIADESIRRFVFAPAGEGFAGIATAEGRHDVGLWSAGELTFLIEQALGSSAPMTPYDIAASTTAGAVLAFIAIVDALRLGRMQSVVDHTFPPGSVSLDEVAARVADSGAEDFRWPLCFIDKLLPTPVAKILKKKTLPSALRELANGGVIDLTEAKGNTPLVVALSGLGELIANSLLHDVSKAAVTATGRVDSGAETETLLMVRSPRDLWLFSIAPEAGAVADLTHESLAALVRAMLSSPLPADGHVVKPKEAVESPVSDQPTPASTPQHRFAGFCAECGERRWLDDDWRCTKGHAREAISGWYDPTAKTRITPPWLGDDAPPPPPPPPPPPSTRRPPGPARKPTTTPPPTDQAPLEAGHEGTFCGKCGTEFRSDAEFCTSCGTARA